MLKLALRFVQALTDRLRGLHALRLDAFSGLKERKHPLKHRLRRVEKLANHGRLAVTSQRREAAKDCMNLRLDGDGDAGIECRHLVGSCGAS
jgi:hypothetical protein